MLNAGGSLCRSQQFFGEIDMWMERVKDVVVKNKELSLVVFIIVAAVLFGG